MGMALIRALWSYLLVKLIVYRSHATNMPCNFPRRRDSIDHVTSAVGVCLPGNSHYSVKRYLGVAEAKYKVNANLSIHICCCTSFDVEPGSVCSSTIKDSNGTNRHFSTRQHQDLRRWRKRGGGL